MQTHELRYFLATARLLNFTKAAEQCGVSQPALTRAIKKLEGELGGALFLRLPGNVELTRLGQALVPQFEEIEQRLEAVRRQAEAMSAQQSSVLRLGVMCTVGPGHVVEVLKSLRTRTPSLDVTIVDAKASDVVRLLVGDEIDLGITAQPVLPDEVAHESLFDEQYVVAIPEGHRLCSNREIAFSELQGVEYLERRSCEFDEHFEAAHRDWPFDFNTVYSSEREDWIQALIASGHGCAIVPEGMSCASGIEKRILVSPRVTRAVSLIYLRGRQLSPIAMQFLRLMKSYRWNHRAPKVDEQDLQQDPCSH